MPSRKMDAAIKVALIGAASVVIAAIVNSVTTNFSGKEAGPKVELSSAPSPAPTPTQPSTLSYNGRVIDANTKAGIRGAQVLVEIDENQPEPHTTDSYGYFHVNVLRDAKSFRVRASAAGYTPFDSGATPVRTGTQEIPLVKALATANDQTASAAPLSKSHAPAEISPSPSPTPASAAPSQQEARESSADANGRTSAESGQEALSKDKETLRQAIRDYVATYGKYDLRSDTLKCVDYNGARAALREISYLAERTGDRAAKEFVKETSPEGHSIRWEPCKE